MELVNNLVINLEQEKVHLFGLFVGLAKEKITNIPKPLPPIPSDDELCKLSLEWKNIRIPS